MNDPEYTGSTVPPSVGSDQPGPQPASTASQEPINVSRGPEVNGEESGHPRMRKGGLFGKLSHQSATNEPGEDLQMSEEPLKFTVGGQLKATVFNSWINVLLVAAPVGSSSRSPHSCVSSAPMLIFCGNSRA